MTPEESEEVRAAIASAKWDSYLYGRHIERTGMLKAIQELVDEGTHSDKTIVTAMLVYLKKKIKDDVSEQAS
jgi:hypothetical protein